MQFLLNNDGALPSGWTKKRRAEFEALGFAFVVPTEKPSDTAKEIYREGKPFEKDGIFYQGWDAAPLIKIPLDPAVVADFQNEAFGAGVRIYQIDGAAFTDDFAAYEAFIATYSPAAAIDRERDRRLSEGVLIGAVSVNCSDVAMTQMLTMAVLASGRIAAKNSTPFEYRDSNGAVFKLDPKKMLSIWTRAAEWAASVDASSWKLKAPGANLDYLNPDYWPANKLP